MDEVFTIHALLLVAQALKMIDASEEDELAFGKLLDSGLISGKGFVSQAIESGVALTPGFWKLYMGVVLASWDKGGTKHAKWLPEIRLLYRPDSESDEESADRAELVLDSAAKVLQALASPPDEDTDNDLAHEFANLARECEAAGRLDAAYDLFAAVMTLDIPHGSERRQIVERALRLAEDAGKPGQIAVCASDIARSAIAIAEKDPTRRLDAFDAVERAIERSARVQKSISVPLAHGLREAMQPHQWLHCLMPLLIFSIGTETAKNQLGEIVGGNNWPERIATQPMDDWLERFAGLLQAMYWEIEIERQRLALEPSPRAESAQADWVSWTVTHPGYSRSIPHNRSFQREANFQQNSAGNDARNDACFLLHWHLRNVPDGVARHGLRK